MRTRHRISLNHAQLNAGPTGEQLANPAARVVDPVLSTGARGYRHPGHIHRYLFPAVPSTTRGGTRIEFSRDDFRRVNARRAPGARTARVRFGHKGEKYALEQYRLAGQQPLEPAEEAMAVTGVDMNMRTVDGTQALISLDKEIDAAEKATAATSYDPTHVVSTAAEARWTESGASPTEQVVAAVSTIRKAIGMRPNVVILGGAVFDAVKIHEEVKLQIRYKDGGKQIGDAGDLAMLWGIQNVYVGDSIWVDESGNTHDTWGNHVVVAYTNIGPVSRHEPSFGYGYQLAGTPLVEEPEFERDSNSWLYYVCDEYSNEIVGKDAGYLLRDVIV